jgi:hypothetical protein
VRVDGGGDALGIEWDRNDWDDYRGYDLDGDGVGDVPYELRSLSNELRARYPDLAFFDGSPTVALTGTAQALGRARDEGALELLLSQPISRPAYFAGITSVRYLVLFGPLVALVVLMSAIGVVLFGEEIAWGFVGRTLAISAALLWAFVGIGLAISTFVRDQAKAMMYALLAWALGIALLDFALVGAMLAWRVDPRAVFLLAAVNPVESARVALLSAAQPELAVLGL